MGIRPPSPYVDRPLMHVSALVHIVADVIAFATFPAFTAWVLFWLPPRNRDDDEDDLRPATA